MHPRIFFLIVVLIFNLADLCGEEQKPSGPPQKATAEQLLLDAVRAIAFIGKTAMECKDKSLDQKNPRQQPFWTALKKIEETTKLAKAQLKSRDSKFFTSLSDNTQDLSELKASYPRSGIKNARVDEGVRVLSNSLTLLRKNYGKEALRIQRGGELSENEKDGFAKLKDAEKKLVGQLKELQILVKDNKHVNAEVARIISQLNKSIDAPLTVASLQNALELIDVVEGEWDAYSYFIEPKYRKAWKEIDAENSFHTFDLIHEENDKRTPVQNWDYVEEPVAFAFDVDVTVAIDPNDVALYENYVAESIEEIEILTYYEMVKVDAVEENAYVEVIDDVEIDVE